MGVPTRDDPKTVPYKTTNFRRAIVAPRCDAVSSQNSSTSG